MGEYVSIINGKEVKDAQSRAKLAVMETTHYDANPETLTTVIANANPGSVIQLAQGTYSRIDLHGKTAYPENLTIVGGDGVTVAGVSITSGVPSWELVRNHSTTDLTITKATLPSGLTFQKLNFTDSFSLRNAQLENLSIINCHFEENTNISITPSYFRDNYGNDHNGNFAVIRPSYVQLTVKNLIIRNCTIENSTVYQYSGTTSSAIQVIGADGANISNNTVNACISSGILVGGVAVDYDIKCSGKISILDNKLHNCSRGIRVYDLHNGELVISNNQITKNSVGVNDGYIRVSTCHNTVMKFGIAGSTLYPANTYDGTAIAEGSGISVYDTDVYDSGDLSSEPVFTHTTPDSVRQKVFVVTVNNQITSNTDTFVIDANSITQTVKSYRRAFPWNNPFPGPEMTITIGEIVLKVSKNDKGAITFNVDDGNTMLIRVVGYA